MDEPTVRLPIAGMTCAHCEATVRHALEQVGARDVRASFRRSEATFRLPPGVTTAALRQAVQDAGYQPGTIAPAVAPSAVPAARDGAPGYDLAIIGSGSAAFAAAIAARDRGARVVMIERSTIGGTCVNVGCVPSKFLLRAAETFAHAGQHPYAGVETRAAGVDLTALVAQKDQLTAAMRQAKYLDLVDAYGWDLIHGEARFVDEGTLTVGTRTIQAGVFLIATGASPAIPAIPGLAEAGYLTSTTAMALDRLPSSLAVIGAGYVALEQGQLFHQLGSAVTLLQRGPRLLADYEPEVSDAVARMLDHQGTRVLTGSRIQRVERTATGRRLVIVRDGREETLEAEEILVAAGRQPNVAALDLDAAGVALDRWGTPVVDAHLSTTNPRVLAAGDVTLAPQFVYVAAYEGGLAARNALSGAAQAVDLRAVPSVIFTDPQIAAVGLTRAQAQAQGRATQSASVPITALARAQVNYETDGVITLVADAATGQVLGAQLVASNAGEVIYAATLAVRYGLTVTDLVESFAPYLTVAEGLRLGALAFGRDVAKLSCCAA